MPPKKDAKGPQANVIDGVSTKEMTREQLEKFAFRLREEVEREREERNFFQIERDKIRTYWELTKDQLDEARAQVRNKDREMEQLQEKNDDDVKLLKQKVKHLQYEHQSNLSETKADMLVSLKLAQDALTEQENELLRDKRDLKEKLREQEIAFQDEVKTMKLKHSEEVTEARNRFENMAHETEQKYEKKFTTLKQDLHIKHKMEMSEVEERKNKQINDLMRNHEKAFSELKNYYNDITLNNLALISGLKDQMENQTNQCERMAKQVADVTTENRKLMEPLKQALAENTELKRQMQNYEKDKMSLHNTKIRLGNTQKELDELKWENDALELRFDKLNSEHEELHSKFVQAILDLQQKTGLKNVLLEKRILKLNSVLENKEASLAELTAAAQLKPEAINTKLEELLTRKNTIIQDLQYELSRVCKAHDDLLTTYEVKLLQYGIPKEELGFTPLRTTHAAKDKLGRGPAGLVTKNR